VQAAQVEDSMTAVSSQKTLQELRAGAPLISAGILTADWMHLDRELAQIEDAGVRLLHFDVMDGRFCPALTLGPPVIKAVKTRMLKDVHIMAEEPLDLLGSFVAAGADIVCVPVEAVRHLHRALQALGELKNANDPERGIVRGVSLNPATPLELVRPVLDEVDLVLLLAVNPGWSGQRFIRSTQAKIVRLQEMIRESKRDVLMEIDGGITKDNIGDVTRMAPDIIVTGSAVFDGKDPAGNARFMMETVKAARRR
jgi:ribulose-phosphate 3-epimerase